MQSSSNIQAEETFQKLNSSFRDFFGKPDDFQELWVYGRPEVSAGKNRNKMNSSLSNCTNPNGGKFK
jgi:hypothetical protein